MREHRWEAGDDLDAQALLYATGEMDPKDAAAFERLLGEDQRAREALALAVELARTLDGLPTPTREWMSCKEDASDVRIHHALYNHGQAHRPMIDTMALAITHSAISP